MRVLYLYELTHIVKKVQSRKHKNLINERLSA